MISEIINQIKKSKYLLQICSYLLFGFVWAYYIWFVDLTGKEFGILFNLLFISVIKILFRKISHRVIINYYVALLLVLGVTFRNYVATITIASPDMVVSGFWCMNFFSIIIIPWLFLIKIFLINFENKIIKILLLFITTIFCLIVTDMVIYQLLYPDLINN